MKMTALKSVAGWAAGLVFLLVLMAWDGYNGKSVFAVIAFLAIGTYALFVHPAVLERRERKVTAEAAHDRERITEAR